jgi:hypothetical protein
LPEKYVEGMVKRTPSTPVEVELAAVLSLVLALELALLLALPLPQPARPSALETTSAQLSATTGIRFFMNLVLSWARAIAPPRGVVKNYGPPRGKGRAWQTYLIF